jgi:hypothetical protein
MPRLSGVKCGVTLNMPPERLVAFAVVEGVLFSGSLCAIFWFKQRSILPGLCYASELISQDEHLHCDFTCTLYGCLLKPPCSIRICEIVIVDSAVQIVDRLLHPRCTPRCTTEHERNANATVHQILCQLPTSPTKTTIPLQRQ